MTDTILAVTPLTDRRTRLIALVAQMSEADIDEAIQLLEWLTDPDLRFAVAALAKGSEQARGQRLEIAD